MLMLFIGFLFSSATGASISNSKQDLHGYNVVGAKASSVSFLRLADQRFEVVLTDSLVTDRLRVYTVDNTIQDVTDSVKDLRGCIQQDRRQGVAVNKCKHSYFSLNGVMVEEQQIRHFRRTSPDADEPVEITSTVNRNRTVCGKPRQRPRSARERNRRQTCYGDVKHSLPLPEEAVVETLLLIEHRLFEALGSDERRATEYAQIYMNAVDLVFAQMHNPRVRIELKKLYIVKSRQNNQFIERNLVSSGNGTVYADDGAVLDDFGTWLFDQGITDYDTATLLTNTDLVESGQKEQDSNGVAYSNSVCEREGRSMSYAVSIAEDPAGQYSGVSTTAHEILHNLGVPSHDSEGNIAPDQRDRNQPNGQGCTSSGKLMARVRGGHTDTVVPSHCSLRQLHYYLSLEDSRCVFEDSGTPSEGTDSRLPGELVSANDQCTALNFPQGACSQSGFTGSEWCSRLRCETSSGCTAADEKPLDGTPCGSGLFCHRGSCVANTPKPSGVWSTWTSWGSCYENVQFRYRACLSRDCSAAGDSIESRCGCLSQCDCPVTIKTTTSTTTTSATPSSMIGPTDKPGGDASGSTDAPALWIYIVAAVGGALLLTVAIVVGVVVCIKRRQTPDSTDANHRTSKPVQPVARHRY